MKGVRNSNSRLVKSLVDISGFINVVENPDLILSLIIEECVLLTRAQWGALLNYDDNLNLCNFEVAKALSKRKRALMASGLNERFKDIINRNRNVSILDEGFWAKADTKAIFKKALGRNARELLISPIKKGSSFMALAIVVNKKGKRSFTDEDRRDLYIMCQEAAAVIENINLIKTKLQSERMAAIGQTIAGISHCVKNILQGISTGSYLLSTGIREKDIAMIKEAWSVVNKNTGRISDLVMDMLYYSKERSPDKQKTNLTTLIDDVIELVQVKLKEKKIKLSVSKKDIPSFITINEKGLHRSILNLILNAIDACDKHRSYIELKVLFDKPRHLLKIIIKDNGKGMSKDEVAKIFQPFYSQKGEGTGLGLAITKKIVEEHNGSIRVDSEPARGSVFEIALPAGTGPTEK